MKTEQLHTHHIVPVYRCKELGLTTSYKIGGKEFYFKENALPGITGQQHANIHWGYWIKDLSPLLELCSPPQEVIDMIPLGDKRDIGAVKLILKEKNERELQGIILPKKTKEENDETNRQHAKKWHKIKKYLTSIYYNNPLDLMIDDDDLLKLLSISTLHFKKNFQLIKKFKEGNLDSYKIISLIERSFYKNIDKIQHKEDEKLNRDIKSYISLHDWIIYDNARLYKIAEQKKLDLEYL